MRLRPFTPATVIGRFQMRRRSSSIVRGADAISARALHLGLNRDEDGRVVFDVAVPHIGRGSCRSTCEFEIATPSSPAPLDSTEGRASGRPIDVGTIARMSACPSPRRPARGGPCDRIWRPDSRTRKQPTAFLRVDPHASIGNIEKLRVQRTARHQRKLIIVPMPQARQVPNLMGP